MGVAAAAAAAMMIGGTAMSANAAKMRQKMAQQAVDIAPVDINKSYGEAFDAMEAFQPRSQALVKSSNAAAQQDFSNLLESSMPGYGSMQKSRIDNTQALLRGEIPDDVRSLVMRQSAGKALSGGYGGTQASRNLQARDLGLTSLDLMGRGQQYSSDIIGSTPLAPLDYNYNQFLDFGAEDTVNLRSKERTEKMQAILAKSKMKGATDVWGSALQQGGGMLAGGMM